MFLYLIIILSLIIAVTVTCITLVALIVATYYKITKSLNHEDEPTEQWQDQESAGQAPVLEQSAFAVNREPVQAATPQQVYINTSPDSVVRIHSYQQSSSPSSIEQQKEHTN